MNQPVSCPTIADRSNLSRHPRSWRAKCPVCQYGGNGTFSVKAGRNGRPLLYCANGCDLELLRCAISGALPTQTPHFEADAETVRARRREAALRLWNGSEPVQSTRAATYLASRGIGHLANCPDLRFRGDCCHPESGKLPALVALIRDAAGAAIGVHRTYLRQDETARPASSRKRLGPIWAVPCASRRRWQPRW